MRGALFGSVTKDELLDAAWADVAVGDGMLRVCIIELRKLLDDTASPPVYIETVHPRGHKFIASLSREARTAGGNRRSRATPRRATPKARTRRLLSGRSKASLCKRPHREHRPYQKCQRMAAWESREVNGDCSSQWV
jgi:DNA-binding winged helix-turn-helix (wHTH) protein